MIGIRARVVVLIVVLMVTGQDSTIRARVVVLTMVTGQDSTIRARVVVLIVIAIATATAIAI